MEHVDGADLAVLAERAGGLLPDEAAALLAQVAEALAAAHAAGIVHRDVKPSNVLVTARRHREAGGLRHRPGARLDDDRVRGGDGSPAYLAPEVASGHPATEASDVWSLGATLYQALTGRPPYDTSDNVLSACTASCTRIRRACPARAGRRGCSRRRWPRPCGPVADEPRPDYLAGRAAGRRGARRADDGLHDRPHGRRWRRRHAQRVAQRPPSGRSWLAPAGLRLGWPSVAGRCGRLLGGLVLRPDSSPHGRGRRSGRRPSPKPATARRSRTRHPRHPPSPPRARPRAGIDSPRRASQCGAHPASAEAAGRRGRVRRRCAPLCRSYVDTALADPAAAWEQLTPRFQQDCCDGSEGSYAGYWNTIATATLRDIEPNPDTMRSPTRSPGTPRASAARRTSTSPSDSSRTAIGYLIDYEL